MSFHDYVAKGDFSDFSSLLSLWTIHTPHIAIFKIEHMTYIPLITTETYISTGLNIEPEYSPRLLTEREIQYTGVLDLHTYTIPLINNNQVVGVVLFGAEQQELCNFDQELSGNRQLVNLTSLIVTSRIQKSICNDMFIANMSHDIRTPLNGIIGYTQILAKTTLTTNQELYISSLRQCSIQLMQIINDILDFFKLICR